MSHRSDGGLTSDRAQIEQLARAKTFFTTRGIKTGDLKTKDQTNADGSVQLQIDSLPGNTFDYLIDATGFRTETLALLQNGFSKELIPDGTPLSGLFEGRSRVLQEGANQQNKGKNRRFVAQLKDPGLPLTLLPVFAVGPANEQIAPLVDADETANVSANTVSLFANIIRTKQLPGALVQSFPRRNPVQRDLSRGSARSDRPVMQLAQGTQVNSEIKLSLTAAPRGQGSYKIVPTKEDLEVGVRKILSSLNVQGATDDFQMWIFLDQRQPQATADQRSITIKMVPGFQQEEDRNVLLAAINGDQAFQDLLFKSFPPDILDSVSGAGENSFNASSQKIVLIDDWNGSSDGTSGSTPLVALRLRADATAKELKKDTGIDLSQVSNLAAGAAARPNQTLLESIARGDSKALCVVAVETGVGTMIRAINDKPTTSLGENIRLLILQKARNGNRIEANLYSNLNYLGLFARDNRLPVNRFIQTLNLDSQSFRPNIQPRYPNDDEQPNAVFPLTIPFRTADGTTDVGIQLRSYVQPSDDFPFGQDRAPPSTTPTIAPTDRPEVLSFNISNEASSKNYLLICTDR